MYTIEQYTNDNISLVDSLVVKLGATAEQINRTIASRYGIKIDEDDPYSWRYYLNISGKKHITNERVEMIAIETDKAVELTREMLLRYPATLRELTLRGEYYMVLINKYPKDISYINGCLNPIDIDTAISAADGTILSYNHLLVDSNEYDLIDGIELYIKGFLNRWFIEDYAATDNLYISSVLGVLFSNLPNKVSNLRLQNINTNKVSRFHLEHFFRSRYDLWDEVSVLNDTSRMWLYKNLDYVIQNIGKHKTFTKLIDNVFESNKIGVGEIILDTAGISPTTGNDIHDPAYTKTSDNFVAKKLNSSYGLEHNNVYSLKNILSREYDTTLTENNPDLDFTHNHIQNRLIKNTQFAQKTKLLDINKFKESKMYDIDMFQFVLEYLATYSANNKYTPVYRYIDVTTNTTYNLTPYDGYLLILKNMFMLHKINDFKLDTLETSYILDTRRSFRSKAMNMYDDESFDLYHRILYDKYPVDTTGFYSVDEFGKYITECADFITTSWIYAANSENAVISANIRLIMERAVVKEKIDFKVDGVALTIDELLSSRDIEILMLGGYDHAGNISELLKIFTGVDIFKQDEITTITNKYVSLLTKLSSYTSQVTVLKDEITELDISYSHLAVLNAGVGFVNVLKAGVGGAMEEPKFKLYCLGNSYVDKVSSINMKRIPYSYDNKAVNNYGYAESIEESELEFNMIKPKMSIVITNRELPMFVPNYSMSANDFIPVLNTIEHRDHHPDYTGETDYKSLGIAIVDNGDDLTVSYNKPFVVVNDVKADFQMAVPFANFASNDFIPEVDKVSHLSLNADVSKTLNYSTLGYAVATDDEFTFDINKPIVSGSGMKAEPRMYFPAANFDSNNFNFETRVTDKNVYPEYTVTSKYIGIATQDILDDVSININKPNVSITSKGIFESTQAPGVATGNTFVTKLNHISHNDLVPETNIAKENIKNQLGYATVTEETDIEISDNRPAIHISGVSAYVNEDNPVTNFDGNDFISTAEDTNNGDGTVNDIKTIRNNEIITYVDDLHDSETILITTTPRMVIEMD